MSEYLEFRCCMCPNRSINPRSHVCPGIPGKLHPEDSECRFVKSYIDNRGWVYKVMGRSAYRSQYKKPGLPDYRFKNMKNLPFRETFDEAQADLNRLAREKGWEELK